MPATMRFIATLSFSLVLMTCCTSLGQKPSHPHQATIHPMFARFFATRRPANSLHVHRKTRPRPVATNRRSIAVQVEPGRPSVAAPTHVPSVPLPRPVRIVRSSPIAHADGCKCCRAAEPLGGSFYAFFDAQIHNGRKAQQVLYHYDFDHGPTGDPTQLNLAGRKKITRLQPLLESTGAPLIVERLVDQPDLSEARRLNVVNYLQSQLGFPIADSQVELGEPALLGVRGVEAVEIDRNQLRTTRSQGVSSTGGLQSGQTSTGASLTGQGATNRR